MEFYRPIPHSKWNRQMCDNRSWIQLQRPENVVIQDKFRMIQDKHEASLGYAIWFPSTVACQWKVPKKE